jgi:hypothetical protein
MTHDIRVKVLSKHIHAPQDANWIRQCPGNLPVWGRCQFTFDPFERAYDWLVIVHDLPRFSALSPKELAAVYTCDCPPEHTVFVTTEPSSITQYGRNFVRQFGYVLTSQEEEALPHPHAIRSQTGNVWFYGKSYDEVSADLGGTKEKLISTVCSSKRQGHTLHAKRFAFTQRLLAALPEMEAFGHGTRFIENKFEAVDPYAFHLAIENHCAQHHWTEKLADAFLGWSVPFYYGCSNVFDYFPRESVIPIDIYDFEGSLRTIRENLSFENYQRRLPAVREARRRVLEEYNLPAMLNRIICEAETAPGASAPTANAVRLFSQHGMRKQHPEDFFRFAWWRFRNFVHGVCVNGGKRE